MTTELIIAVLGLIGTLIGGGILGTIAYRRQNRRLKDVEVINAELSTQKAELDLKLSEVEVDKAKDEYNEARISQLHEVIDGNNKTMTDMSATIAMLNHTIDDKTARIREVEDSLAVTERENTRLAEENGALKTDLALNRCVIRKCGGRDPQNEHTIAALQSGTAVFPSAPSVDVSVEVDVEKPVKKTSKRKAVVKE